MQGRTDSMARGIDVSKYQGTINWQAVRNSGISFAIVKATEGVGYVDPDFVDNLKGAKAAGLLTGVYHFLTPSTASDAADEAACFVETIEPYLDLIDLPPVLDFEQSNRLSPDALVQMADVWLTDVKAALGITPRFYTYPYFAGANLESAFSDYPLWIASYSESAPGDVAGWTEWEFWQYSEKGSVPGIDGPVDLDVYNGSEEDLKLAFDKEAKRMLEELQQQVAALQAQVTELEQKTANLTVTPAPDWFVEEFSSADAGGLITTPQGDYDFWRSMAVMIRLIRRLKIQES